jgi:hypothetical protein
MIDHPSYQAGPGYPMVDFIKTKSTLMFRSLSRNIRHSYCNAVTGLVSAALIA